MMQEHRPLYNISHPFIDSMYLKKEFSADGNGAAKDILVIETKCTSDIPTKREREDIFFSLLGDLSSIKAAVEKKAGKFNRIDIRYH